MTLVTTESSQITESFPENHFDLQEFMRVNEDHKRITGQYLMDINMIRQFAFARANPEKFDTSLPALRPGVREIVIDIFKQGGMREVMEDDPLEPYDLPFVTQKTPAIADEQPPSDSILTDELPEEGELVASSET